MVLLTSETREKCVVGIVRVAWCNMKCFIFFSMASHNKQDPSCRKSPSGKIKSLKYRSYLLPVNQKGRKLETTTEGQVQRLALISTLLRFKKVDSGVGQPFCPTDSKTIQSLKTVFCHGSLYI